MKLKIQMVVTLSVAAVMFFSAAAIESGKKVLSNRSYLPPVTASKAGGAPPACPTGGCPNG